MIAEAIIIATPGTVAALVSLASHRKIRQVDQAVNGAGEGEDSIRENVQTLVRRRPAR